LIVLVDGGSASSGEDLVAKVAAIPGAMILGEATSGTRGFGNMMNYYLGNSGIQIWAGFPFGMSPT
jgi:C-terminal processing protease CtpA/Prc